MPVWLYGWRDLQAQLSRIEAKINALTAQETKAMAAIDDLNTAVTTLAGNFTTLDQAIQAEIAALKAALAAGNDAAIETAATNIGNVSAKMAADAQALTASLTP